MSLWRYSCQGAARPDWSSLDAYIVGRLVKDERGQPIMDELPSPEVLKLMQFQEKIRKIRFG